MKPSTRVPRTKYWFCVMCVLAGAVALLPVSCDYILSGVRAAEWLARVEELAAGFREGQFVLFPSAETLAKAGAGAGGMNSNLWFVLPGILYWLTGNLVAAYRVYMVLIQAGTLFGSVLFFRRVFQGEKGRTPAFFGVLLYMTCPYRIYACYDLGDLSQAVAWMLLPLYAWAVAGILEESSLEGAEVLEESSLEGAEVLEGSSLRGKETLEGSSLEGKRSLSGRRKLWFVLAGALALAGLGYGDVIFFVTAAGITLLAAAVSRRLLPLICTAGGALLFLPGLARLYGYLFQEGFQELGLFLGSIMPQGYSLGQYFSSYAWRDGHPGMGLGMIICLMAAVWLGFVEGEKEERKVCRVFQGLAAFLALLSFNYFPWDHVQRLGLWALKLVSLVRTPAVFWGMAFFALCVPAAGGMDRISKKENRLAAFVVPVLVLTVCLGLCIYQCGMLIYDKVPVELQAEGM